MGIAVATESLPFVPRSLSSSTSSTTGKGVTLKVAAKESVVGVRTRNTCSPTGQSGAISNTHLRFGHHAGGLGWFSGGVPIGSIDTTRIPGL